MEELNGGIRKGVMCAVSASTSTDKSLFDGFLEPNYVQFSKLRVGMRYAKKRTQLGLNGRRIMRKLRKIEDRKSDFIIQVIKSRNKLEIIDERRN